MSLPGLQSFAAAANEAFDVDLGESTMAMTLVEVHPLPVMPYPGMLREPFSLVFRSASQLILPQRIYRLVNATLGKLDIFMVPVGRDAGGTIYQAVFN